MLQKQFVPISITSGEYIRYASILSNFAMREAPGSIIVTIEGLRSGRYKLILFHHGAQINHGMNIYVSDYNNTWSRRQVATDFIGSYGATADNSLFSTLVIVNGSHPVSLVLEVEMVDKSDSPVSWANYLVFNGFQLVEIERFITITTSPIEISTTTTTSLPIETTTRSVTTTPVLATTTIFPPLLNTTTKTSLLKQLRKKLEDLSYLWALLLLLLIPPCIFILYNYNNRRKAKSKLTTIVPSGDTRPIKRKTSILPSRLPSIKEAKDTIITRMTSVLPQRLATQLGRFTSKKTQLKKAAREGNLAILRTQLLSMEGEKMDEAFALEFENAKQLALKQALHEKCSVLGFNF